MESPQIIFEDEHLLVLNKPADVVVNRAQSVKVSTLQDWVEAYLADNKHYQKSRQEDEAFSERSGMVHRLDKDTSGVILFAKDAATMHELLLEFQARRVEKTYLALVHGKFTDPAGIISAPIQRHQVRRDIFTVTTEGRPSVTQFARKQEFPVPSEEKLRALAARHGKEGEYKNLRSMLKLYEGGFSLLSLQPKTGRTHQLRVHLKFIHHPIVGDERYVGEKRWKLDKLWCPRQWLHAHSISIKGRTFMAELAKDLEATIELLTQV